VSLTPVGDYLAKRYPPGNHTHAMGDDAHPLGCLAWHSTCLYAAAWREALRSFAADLDKVAAEMAGKTSAVSDVIAPTAAIALTEAAGLARAKMEASP
jgi:hypothetical protein